MPCHGIMSAPFCGLCHILRVNLKMWYKPLLMRFRGTLCSGKPSYPSCTSCSLDALASASNFAPGDCGGWCSDAFAEAVDGANCHLEPGEEMDWRMDVRFIAGVFFMFIHDFSPGNLFYIILHYYTSIYLQLSKTQDFLLGSPQHMMFSARKTIQLFIAAGFSSQLYSIGLQSLNGSSNHIDLKR